MRIPHDHLCVTTSSPCPQVPVDPRHMAFFNQLAQHNGTHKKRTGIFYAVGSTPPVLLNTQTPWSKAGDMSQAPNGVHFAYESFK